MALWGKQRYDILSYPYYTPPYDDVRSWADRAPTVADVSPVTIQPGHAVLGKGEIWLCMNTLDLTDRVDVHWLFYSVGKISHTQQDFKKVSSPLWPCAFYQLDLKKPEQKDHCPHCKTKLEWVAMALRCPKCLYVGIGGA